jgi:hypothetical protein
MSLGQIPGWQWGMVTAPVYPAMARFTRSPNWPQVAQDGEPILGVVRECVKEVRRLVGNWNMNPFKELQSGPESN